MNQSLSKTFGKAAFGALALILTFGTNAGACNLPGSGSLRSALLANPSLRIAIPRSQGEALQAQRGATTPASVVGLWQVTYFASGSVVDMAFEVFHSDGTEMLNDITPPAEGNVCLGVWVQTTSTSYTLTHPSWTFDASGNLTGTADFAVTITLDSADKFSGTYTLSYFDVNGNKGPVYSGTMTATRIVPNY